MNDTISSAVVLAGILPEHREAVTAHLENVRQDATRKAVQLYIDRACARDAGSAAGVIFSATLGRSYATRGQDYYGDERWQYQATNESVMVAYTRDQLVRNELGELPGVTDADSPAWTGDPFGPESFAFVTVSGDVDADDVYAAVDEDEDEDEDPDD
jgi:hypothetical protein